MEAKSVFDGLSSFGKLHMVQSETKEVSSHNVLSFSYSATALSCCRCSLAHFENSS